jgi:hypothetical protein
VTLCGLPAAAKQDCITFSVVLANPLRATGPSKLVEALPLRGDAIHEVSYEPSAGQVLIAFTAVAAAELRRVAEQYHDARPPHFVRISRAGYAPIEWFIFVPNRVRRIHVSAPNEKIGGEMVRMLSHRCGAPDPDAPYPGIDWDEPLPGPPPS